MKTSELIAALQREVELSGDLTVSVCGMDGAGYDDVTEVRLVNAVVVDSIVSTYVDPRSAEFYGVDPSSQVRLLHIQ